ncbi:zinc finger CCHC domain-containing protein 8 homolog [Prorops nasuta]|uniref:zinc finger CCHC domain-containing protein 8 homolog n=1 Tax=Prorops nasuta TaxID=863751 RepID=UPI0034CEA015
MSLRLTLENTEEKSSVSSPNVSSLVPCPNAPNSPIAMDNSGDNAVTNVQNMNENESGNTVTMDNTKKSQPLLTITFRDENAVKRYRESIRKFLENLTALKCTKHNSCNETNLILEIWDSDGNEQKGASSSSSTEVESDSQDEYDRLFMIDKSPCLNTEFDVPTYGKKYETIVEKLNVKEAQEEESCQPKIQCFNCLGNHNMRDCPEPRNREAITKNRNKNNSKMSRYHLEDEQKFGHLVPGQISSQLRKALGLKDNQLPKHIYRMRVLGYPPGWLEEARLQHSGLSLFDSEGQEVGDPDDEPGEIFAEGDKDRYDIKKIFDYPGFNVPPPPGTRDDSDLYFAPQMLPEHSKEAMLHHLKERMADEGYKRKKLKLKDRQTSINLINTVSDMEIDETSSLEVTVETVLVNGHFVPPLPKESQIIPPEPPSTSSENLNSQSQDLSLASESAASTSRANSPSLSDLETMKNQLLVALEDSSSQSNLEALGKSEKAEMPPPPTEESLQDECIVFKTPNSKSSIVSLGTPILQSTSPYNKLPSFEKFSKNISEVLNFENLPDYTGKYEKMTGILQKVRQELSKIHQD